MVNKVDFLNQKKYKQEQIICKNCGFCCDGTLFEQATLQSNEVLPAGIELNKVKIKRKEYFNLPCFYFKNNCSIYHSPKARICSSFRCKLLRDVERGKITKENAVKLIKETKQKRAELVKEFEHLINLNKKVCFREMLKYTGLLIKKNENEQLQNSQIDLFQAKCNIFEVFLTKYFKSEMSYHAMIET